MSPHELSRINQHILQYDVAGYAYLAWAMVFLFIFLSPKSGMRSFLMVAIISQLMVSFSGFASAHALRYSHPENVPTYQWWGTIAKAVSAAWVVMHAPELVYIFQIWGKTRRETRGRLTRPDVAEVNVFVKLRRLTHVFGRDEGG